MFCYIPIGLLDIEMIGWGADNLEGEIEDWGKPVTGKNVETVN